MPRVGRRQRARACDRARARLARRAGRRVRPAPRAARGDGGADRRGRRHRRGGRDRHPRRAGGRRARRRDPRAPREARRARQQRRRTVPQPRRGDLAEGLSHGGRAQRPGHVADDPLRRDEGVHPAALRQGGQRHRLSAPRDAGDGPHRRRAGGGREHDAHARDRVGALQHQAVRRRRGSVRHRGPPNQVPEAGERERRAHRPARPARDAGGDGVVDRLSRLPRRGLLLGRRAHARRRARQLVRLVAADRGGGRSGLAARRGARAARCG